MPFFAFNPFWGLLALVLLAIVTLIALSIRRKRQALAMETDSEVAVAELAPVPPLSPEQYAQPNTEPEPASLQPVRRRQLQSFAENERLAAEAEGTLPAAPAEPEPEQGREDDPEPQPASAPAQATEFDVAVLARLEAAFDDLQSGEITFDAYRERLLAEKTVVEEHIAELETGGDSEELDAALAAQESVEWCLNWAAEQEGLQES